MEEFSKEKKKELAKNRESLIREREPIHSKTPNQNWYDHYDETFKKKKRKKKNIV